MKAPKRLFAVIAVLAALLLVACGANASQSSTKEDTPASAAANSEGKDFASWTDDSPTVKLVKEYVADVTDENSENFIPKEDRIVTIDFDGTLFAELDPVYFDWAIVIHRVLWDSTYSPTSEQIEVAHTIEKVEQTRVFPDDYDITHASTLAKIFEGKTQDELIEYAKGFAETDAPKFKNLKRKDSYFRPMIELVKYLEANDFTCYIVSGTDRTILRALLPYSGLNIPSDHIIGSPANWVATGQGDEDGLKYQLTDEDQVVSGGELLYKDLKMNKVSAIQQEIGKQPVISLGNSSGDNSMANYATKNNKYKSIALMLCCDDTERDWGELSKAESMKESCEKNGWHAVSQKNEWKTFFGDNVTIDKDWVWSSEKAGPFESETENTASDSTESTDQDSEEELAQAA